MEKKVYDGLKVMFTPIEEANIVSTSKPCEIISVQYYVGQYGVTQCDPEGDRNNPIDDEYSYNWNEAPYWG